MIPAHGRVSDHADVVCYRDVITIVRDRIQDMIKNGMTLARSEGGQADPRLRRALREDDRAVDHRHVRRGGV